MTKNEQFLNNNLGGMRSAEYQTSEGTSSFRAFTPTIYTSELEGKTFVKFGENFIGIFNTGGTLYGIFSLKIVAIFIHANPELILSSEYAEETTPTVANLSISTSKYFQDINITSKITSATIYYV